MLTALASTRSGFSRPVMFALIGQTADMFSKTPELFWKSSSSGCDIPKSMRLAPGMSTFTATSWSGLLIRKWLQ